MRNPIEWIKLLVVLVFAVAVVMLVTGCASRIPDNINDCEIKRYVEQWDTVEDCKMAVLKVEDIKFKRTTKKLENERNSRLCYIQGKVWDARSLSCKYWSML